VSRSVILRGAHVIDPAQDIDRIADVIVADGKIAGIGDGGEHADATVVDCTGAYVTPGWIDIHVHAYGRLGFADPDSIGIAQGVTSFVEAGGPGIGTFDEFLALMTGLETRLYAGIYLRPLGILGLNALEGNVRNLGTIPFRTWLDVMDEHRDTIRYLKVGAFEKYGSAPVKIGKGLAELLELPMYVHTGDFTRPEDRDVAIRAAFDVAGAGDIITHLYHKNFGNVLDDDGRVLQPVWDAAKRGVIFDIGFGGSNFSWDVAEKSFAQGLYTDIISSDLQQFNVMGPAFSLANVMSILHHVGYSIEDTIERVTSRPARALKLDDRAGSLRVGMPADITVFRIEAGEFDLADCFAERRIVRERFVPIAAYKDGKRFDSDLERCQDERNWFLEIAYDHIPEAVATFAPVQLAFLEAYARELAVLDWTVTDVKETDLSKAEALQAALHRARTPTGIGLAAALKAVYGCFLDSSFAIQIGIFLIRLERAFVLERIETVVANAKVHL
jgi:dihydroorotase